MIIVNKNFWDSFFGMRPLVAFLYILFSFQIFAEDDVFDLENGAKKKVKEIVSFENLNEYLVSGEYDKLESGIQSWLKDKKEEAAKSDFRKLRLKFQIETGRYKEALEILESKALDEDDHAIYLHATVLIHLGEYEKAKVLAEEGLVKFKDSHSLTYILYRVAELTGNAELDSIVWAKVKKMYFKSKSGREGEAFDVALIGQCIRLRYPQKAYIMYQRAYKKDETLIDTYVWAGNHCAEKYEWNFSIEELSKALKINPNHAEANAGLARVLIERGDYQKARELVALALQINPNCSNALQLLSSIHLVDDQKRDAKKVLEHGLETNPNDLKILSQLAAGYHQEGETEKRDEIIKKVLEINPKYSKVYLALSQSCEDLRQFPEAVDWAKKAIENNPKDWEGYFMSGMNLLRLGEETEGYKILDKAFALNGFNIWARNILVLLDRDFKKKEFKQFETEHFVIKLHRSESEIMFPYLKDVVEQAYEKYCKKYDIEPVGPKEYNGKILLLMFDRHNDFSARTVGLPGLGALGACFGQIITMPSPIIGKGSDEQKFHWKRVFEHEFIHVLTLQKSSYHIPRWFTEGISTWEEEDPQSEVDRQLRWAWKNGRLLHLEDINSGFSQQTYPNQIGVSYYHASLICSYLNDNYGFDVIMKMLKLFGDNKSNEVVLTEATGKSLTELNKEIRDYLDRYISKIPLTLPLEESELSELANKYQSFGLPIEKQLDLAAGYIRMGEREKSKEIVDKVLKEDSVNVRALNMNAMLLFHDDEKEAAKKAFEKVLEHDPVHYTSNYFMAMMAQEKEDWKGAVKHYKQALKQYPRVESSNNNIYYKIADIYEEQDQQDKVLEILHMHTENNNKNFTGFVRYARKLLEFNKKEEAAIAYLEANYIYPFDLDVHREFGEVLVDLKRFEEADREFSIAAELAPRDKGVLVNLYKIKLNLEKQDEAKELLKRLKRFFPDDDFKDLEKNTE